MNDSLICKLEMDAKKFISKSSSISGLNQTAQNQITSSYDFEFDLSRQQEIALADINEFLAGMEVICVLSGYAGTGKTTLMGVLANQLRMRGGNYRIAVAAPTNKAVSVLKSKIQVNGVEFASIHSFLGLKLEEKDNGDQKCTKNGEPRINDFNLLIVDECSMISRDLLSQILAHQDRSLKILFVGDPAQLPPVGEKVRSLTFDLECRKVELTEVVRQAKENPVIALSLAIREAMAENQYISAKSIFKAVESFTERYSGIDILMGGTQVAVQTAIMRLREDEDCRIICYTNATALQMNKDIHDALYPDAEFEFVVGQRAIVHNSHKAYLVNEKCWANLSTSEEILIEGIHEDLHKDFAEINAVRILARRDNDEQVEFLVAQDQIRLKEIIAAKFKKWRMMKDQAEVMKKNNDFEFIELEMQAKDQSREAWKCRNLFCELRHPYAITSHKSQGSTFDSAIVLYPELRRMKTPFEFNRALYVAVTRPKNDLIVVVA